MAGKCCAKCYGRQGTTAGGGVYCWNYSCKCHVEEFLRESNAIEGVYDEDSLVQAKKAWDYLIGQPIMTTGVILNTHASLMKNQPIERRDIGQFRFVKVWISGKEAVKYTDIPKLLDRWIRGMNIIPLPDWEMEFLCKKFHVEYEHIHPFVDGNGRTGRMFMNWQRLKAGLPLLIIHRGEEQMEYYKWFRE